MKLFALLPLLAGLAGATTNWGVNGPCLTDNTLNCDADVTFDFSVAGQLTLTVENDTVDLHSATQLLSAIQFVLSTGSGGSLSSSSGQERTVHGDGTFTDGATVATGWVFSEATTTFTLDVLSGTGHAGPAHTIIGDPGAGGTYTTANGIAGNGPHNPVLDNPVTFVLSIAGIDATTTVQSFKLQFGTGDGELQGGSLITPEPMSMLLTGAGLVGLGLIRRKLRA